MIWNPPSLEALDFWKMLSHVILSNLTRTCFVRATARELHVQNVSTVNRFESKRIASCKHLAVGDNSGTSFYIYFYIFVPSLEIRGFIYFEQVFYSVTCVFHSETAEQRNKNPQDYNFTLV